MLHAVDPRGVRRAARAVLSAGATGNRWLEDSSRDIESAGASRVVRSLQARLGGQLGLSPITSGDRRKLSAMLSDSDAVISLLDESTVALGVVPQAARGVRSGAVLIRSSAAYRAMLDRLA